MDNNEEEKVGRVPLPNRNNGEMFGIVDKMLGAARMVVMCEDGKSRQCRVPGKIKKRIWVKEGDLVIIKPWDFQDEKADIVYRYTPTQTSYLSRNKILPEILDVFGKA
ncbi:MAG: translation initiation factor eIF-1A [Thermoplasmata archaeon]|nr:translation initiation factor eIF-1A [Thermoplasmata archaeon]